MSQKIEPVKALLKDYFFLTVTPLYFPPILLTQIIADITEQEKIIQTTPEESCRNNPTIIPRILYTKHTIHTRKPKETT